MPAGLEDHAKSMNIELVNVKIVRLDDIFTTIDQLGKEINETGQSAGGEG